MRIFITEHGDVKALKQNLEEEGYEFKTKYFNSNEALNPTMYKENMLLVIAEGELVLGFKNQILNLKAGDKFTFPGNLTFWMRR